ncbi:MAG: hypothetical protein CMO34_00270 [Verrucomicrobia bacterium]|nr:hypothetical protein [Verrucomicrobiota bacterium]|tara:strand:+ start:351 stop:893 length:543 start_codon:yes stop_codon:yes gene_type:complete
MEEFSLKAVETKLKGPSIEQIVFHNQWAAVAFDIYHYNSKTEIEIEIDGKVMKLQLSWDSNFSSAAMKEKKDMANHGGVALAWFVMSVLLDYGYVEQTEIGTGVDYRFRKSEPADDDLNFMDDFHYTEISGILEESQSNKLSRRIKEKHEQISRGEKSGKSSSIIVTLFSQPKTVKEIHN